MAQELSYKKKVLVLGASGLIGHQIYNHLKTIDLYEVYGFRNRNNKFSEMVAVDARNESKLLLEINKISPDLIINCIGILISESRNNPANAIFLNAYLPNFLSDFATKAKSKLIHISTDCVFSGEKDNPYLEDDNKDGRDIYARTKGLGEIISSNHLTLRTSVIGPEIKLNGEELFHWFMNQNNAIEGYTESIWSGVTTLQLAKAVESSIRLDISGLHHVTNNETINKFDLLSLIKIKTNKNIEIKKVQGRKTNKSFLDTRGELDIEIPSYEFMIEEMVDVINKNENLYRHYLVNSDK